MQPLTAGQQALCARSQRIAVAAAKYRYPRQKILDWHEIRSASGLGLVLAAASYDPALGDEGFYRRALRLCNREISHEIQRSLGIGHRRLDGAAWCRALRRRMTSLDARDDVVDPGPGPAGIAEAADDVAALRRAVALLPSREESVISRILDGASCDQIAREMGLSRSLVFRIRRDAERLLRETMA